jgi:hypothetical protein
MDYSRGPRATRRDFEGASRALSGREESKAFHFESKGRRFQARWAPGGRNRPNILHLSTPLSAEGGSPEGQRPVENPAPLLLRAENRADRLGKWLGINREVQTGDPPFDARIYLESEAPERAIRQVLRDWRVRESVLACLEGGATAVALGKDGELEVTVQTPREEQVTPAGLVALGELLSRVAETLPPLRPLAPGSRRASMGATLTKCIMVGSLLAALACLLATARWDTVDHALQWRSALGGLVLWGLCIPLLIRVLRGRSTSFRDLGLSVFCLSFGLPTGSAALLLFINCGLDFSEPTLQRTRVTGKREVRQKSSSNYYVHLSSWSPGMEDVSLPVNRSTHNMLRKGQPLMALTRPGLLGKEWVLSLETLDSSTD